MSAALLQLRFYLRQRGLLFWSFFVPVVFFTPLLVLAHRLGRVLPAMDLLVLLGISSGAGTFLASAQREILSKAQYFMMPAVRRGMLGSQLLTGFLLVVLGTIAVSLVPELHAVIRAEPNLLLVVAALMIFSFAVTMLLVFQFVYAAWLPFQFMWLFALGVKPLQRVSPEQLRAVLGQTSLLCAAAALAAFVVWQQMSSRGVQRRLSAQPFISIADLKRPQRVEAFRRARSLHKSDRPDGIRFLDGVLQGVLCRISNAHQAGRQSTALVWEAVFITFSTTVPRLWWRALLLAGFFPATLIVFGYFDAREALRADVGLNGWFSGMVFMGVVTVPGMMAYPLRARIMGRLVGRVDALRAGWLSAVVMLVGGLLASALLFGVGHGLAAILPPVTLGGILYHMIPPRAYLLGASLFILPFQLLVFSLWRRPGSQMVLQQTGTMVFFIYHIGFNAGGRSAVLPIGTATILLWLTLAGVWRWRALRADLD